MAKYLTMSEVRQKLGGRSRSSIYLDIRAKRLPSPFKFGARLFWKEDEVDAAIEGSRS